MSVQAAVQIAQPGRWADRVRRARCLRNSVCPIRYCSEVERSRFCEPSSSFASKGRFLRRVGRFFPKAARFGSKSPGFSPEGATLLPISPSFLGTARGGVQKIPRCLPDSGGMSFAARISGRVALSGFSTWRRWGAIA